MSNTRKLHSKKNASQSGMRNKYWKQVFTLADKKAWEDLCGLVEKNRWLATASISAALLPDYLAEDKQYGLLRLLANVEDIPTDVIRKMIALGAHDKNGRCYLVRLLAGGETGSDDRGSLPVAEKEVDTLSDSPLIAAELLKTADQPVEIIKQMQRTLEHGVNDSDPQRRILAERCIKRSQLFFDLVLLLQEQGVENRLSDCLACEELLLEFQDPQKRDWSCIASILEPELEVRRGNDEQE